jgi:hypothetical protein
VVSFGLAVGITFSLVTVLLGFSAVAFGWGIGVVQVLSSLFVGYGPSFVGVIAGGVWAFFDGFIAGVLIAWLYNRLLLRRRRPAP